MGLTFVDVALTAFRDVSASFAGSFLVDTGATDSMAPASALRRAGIEPTERSSYRVANGGWQRYDFALVRIEFLGEVTAGRVLFGPDDIPPLLGATALESALDFPRSRCTDVRYRERRHGARCAARSIRSLRSACSDEVDRPGAGVRTPRSSPAPRTQRRQPGLLRRPAASTFPLRPLRLCVVRRVGALNARAKSANPSSRGCNRATAARGAKRG